MVVIKNKYDNLVRFARMALWLSWLKRLPSKQEIAGSNPTGACVVFALSH